MICLAAIQVDDIYLVKQEDSSDVGWIVNATHHEVGRVPIHTAMRQGIWTENGDEVPAEVLDRIEKIVNAWEARNATRP